MSTLDDAWSTVRAKSARLKGMNAFPLWTAGDRWVTATLEDGDRGILPHDGSWMAGDLPAILWFLADVPDASDDAFHTAASEWSGRLANRTTITSFASVSHMFYRGALIPLLTHGATELEPMLTHAACTISDRFQRIGYMKSFGEPDDDAYPLTTIDDVINLCIPLWYAQRTADDALAAAVFHAAQVIADHLIRDDGSAGQVLHFDDRGRPAHVGTYQGRTPDGCWSRGLAWGIYGYAILHSLSGDPVHLQHAQTMTDYWIDRVQDDPAPLWDFDLGTGDPQDRDSFAASLAYAGILEAASASEPERAGTLRDYAADMTRRLAERYVIGQAGPGILHQAALDVPHRHGVGEDAAVIVGDSYFTETLWRLRGDADGPLLRTTTAADTASLKTA